MLPSCYGSFMVTMVLVMEVSETARVARYQNCLARCEFEIRNTDELVVFAEDILSFQRFFDPRLVGHSLNEVTSLRVSCSKALLAETVTAFHSTWASVIPRLLRLQLHGCRVMSLASQAFNNFHSLTSLTIDNQDEGSPYMPGEGSLQGLRNLASFMLTRVRLRSVDRSLFHKDARHNLMKVYLSHNALTRIDKHTFCGMRRLSDLDLSFNKLVGNKLDFLRCINSLYLLNISNNVIQNLEHYVFRHNHMLHTLDLSFNKMKTISRAVRLINATSGLKEVYLAGNPWECNVTSLFQLHYLGGKLALKIVDWRSLTCLQDGEWVQVHGLLFPYAFSRFFRAWHMLVVGGAVAVCLCCVLVLKCNTDPPNTSPWLWLQKYLLQLTGGAGGHTPTSPSSKLPRATTCVSVVQCSEDEPVLAPAGHLATDNGVKINGMTEVLIDKILNDLPRTKDAVESSNEQQQQQEQQQEGDDKNSVTNDLHDLDDSPDDAHESSYISYKTHLDPDAQSDEEETHTQDKSPAPGPSRPTALSVEAEGGERGAAGGRGDGAPKETPVVREAAGSGRVTDDGEGGAAHDGSFTPSTEKGLPLTTSAGVATTPTETQTTAMAGLRGVTQYTVSSSWLTVDPLHLPTTSDPHLTPTHRPPPTAHRPPSPLELLAAKIRQQKASRTFTLHSPPSLPPSRTNSTTTRGDMKRGGGGVRERHSHCRQSPRQSPSHPPTPQSPRKSTPKHPTLPEPPGPGVTQESSRQPSTRQQTPQQTPSHQQVSRQPLSHAHLTQQPPPPSRPVNQGRQQEGRPAVGDAGCPPEIWQTNVRMANITSEHAGVRLANMCGEQLVCRSCLAALSLPDVHSSNLLQYGTTLGPGWPEPQYPAVTLNKTSASLRRHRFSHSSSAEGHGSSDETSGKPSTITKTTGRNLYERPVYRSLERGTKRRPVSTYYGDEQTQPRQPRPDMISVAGRSVSAREEATGDCSFTDSPHLMRIDEQRTMPQRDSKLPNESSSRGKGTKCSSHKGDDRLLSPRQAGATPSTSNARDVPQSPTATAHEQTHGPCHRPKTSPSPAPVRETAAAPAAASTSHTPNRSPTHQGKSSECSCRCEAHQPPQGASGPSEGGGVAAGEHCDIDIETQATQIIDMVELHAQSPCNPS